MTAGKTMNWADEVDEESEGRRTLPPASVVERNGMKIVTEYRISEDTDKMEKVVRTYKMERRVVTKSMAQRKAWEKFGLSKRDKPGPNAHTTIVSEEVLMQFITNKDEADKPDEDSLKEKLKNEKGLVKCRVCGGEHWTLSCPYKDTMAAKTKMEEKAAAAALAQTDKQQPQKYIAPSLREGANKRGESMNSRSNDALAVRITNLSIFTTEQDLEDLVRPFGNCVKIYLAKDKATGLCKGFAYIHYKTKMEAQAAIMALNGFGYDHLILSVDWSKPANN